MGSHVDFFIKRLYSKDKQAVISTLGTLRHKIAGKSPRYSIDCVSFQLIVSFLKQPNQALLSNTLSLLANCCIHEVYRKYFSCTEGVSDLLVVLKSIASDEIACRAWRLAGNLCQSADLCKALICGGLPDRMLAYFQNINSFTPATRGMVFRTVRKCCDHKATRPKITTDDFISKLKHCLSSQDKDTVLMTLQLLFDLVQHSSSMDIEKKDITELVELAKDEAYTEACVKCLSAVVSNHVVSHLIEGSGVLELFIEYVKKHSDVGKGFLSAMCKLCREGAVRNRIKSANLFPALIKLCRGPKVPILLLAFTQFQYDEDSIVMLSQSQDLLSVLMENVMLTPAVFLLNVIARLEQPVPALIETQNLDIFVQSPQCSQLLSKIVNDKKYFKALLLSGRVWSICGSGCPMDEIGSSGYAVGVVEHCLHTCDDNKRKVVSMAVPFLVKPRNFSLLYKLLARQNAMSVILQALEEYPPAESTVASIVRLVELFREHHKGDAESMELDASHLLFLEELEGGHGSHGIECADRPQLQSGGDSVVTFELDGGTCVSADKDLLCAQSPVVNAMLNGHFAEANQNRVRLQDCSRRAFASLVLLLEGRLSTSCLELDTQLELVSLTDRLLIPALGDSLTRCVPLSGANCAQVYLWSRSAGHSVNASRIRARAYWELLSSADQLMPALKNQACRQLLVEEINVFLNRCLSDLL